MDVLSKEKCQAIIDSDHNWEEVNATKTLGGILKFKTANFIMWKNHYPNILKECVMKYEVGDFCSEHIDNLWTWENPNYHAYAVWTTPLNDDYEGGELYFEGNLIEQVVGVPVKYLRTVPHKVTEVTKGTRYSLVSWVFVPKHG